MKEAVLVHHRRHEESQACSRNQKHDSRRLTRSIMLGIISRQHETARQALFQRLQRVKLHVPNL
jgi:hypothetical protein